MIVRKRRGRDGVDAIKEATEEAPDTAMGADCDGQERHALAEDVGNDLVAGERDASLLA